jgi:hypothetical protein
VFPCASGGNQPLIVRGYRDATTSARRIGRWWAWQSDANIGISAGHGLDVLDIDVHAGGDGYRVLERLHRSALVPGALDAVRTPSGVSRLCPGASQLPNSRLPRRYPSQPKWVRVNPPRRTTNPK